MQIDVKLEGLTQTLTDMENKKFAVMRLAAMAMNRAAAYGKTIIAQSVKGQFTMTARDIKAGIKIDKANMRWLTAEITVTGKSIPLILFQHKGTGGRYKRGVKALSKTKTTKGGRIDYVQVMVKRAGGYKLLKNAFIARSKYGDAVYVRIGKKAYPLKMLYGPSLPGVLKGTVKIATVIDAITRKWEMEFRQGLKYALDKGRVAGDDNA